jgi:hypothetical protein
MAMRIWKNFLALISLILGLSSWGYSEPNNSRPGAEEPSGQGYVFFAPGGIVGDGNSISTFHVGGGGEGLLYKGFGIGGEIGYLTPWQYVGSGIGIASADGSYHFNRTSKVSPFITGGYSVAFREGHINLINFGGGVNYWFRKRMGLRVEFRDHMDLHNDHYVSGRIGLSFR